MDWFWFALSTTIYGGVVFGAWWSCADDDPKYHGQGNGWAPLLVVLALLGWIGPLLALSFALGWHK